MEIIGVSFLVKRLKLSRSNLLGGRGGTDDRPTSSSTPSNDSTGDWNVGGGGGGAVGGGLSLLPFASWMELFGSR